MKFKKHIAAVFALSSGAAFAGADVPVVSSCTMVQNSGGRTVTIKYAFEDNTVPAVVTLDVKTNVTGRATANESDWVSIGGEHIWNAQGAVWRKVTEADVGSDGKFTITWDPTYSWTGKDGKGFTVDAARVCVTAWPLNNTPDYMVVDISDGAEPNSQRYYPSVDFLPGSEPGQKGAVTNNPVYRLTSLLMRKIMAKGITWTMGSTAQEKKRNATQESTHSVTLDGNYYIGVFEVTQSQWALIQPACPNPSFFSKPGACAMRPVEWVSYNEIRNNDGTARSENVDYNWPNEPNPNSFLGLLCLKTGIVFDLTTEAQWEFAARAGNGTTRWGDGSGIDDKWDTDDNLARLGRYCWNNKETVAFASSYGPTYGPDSGTAYAGSYLPNDWGIYDMFGNVAEWCLDYFEENIGDYNGMVNIDPTNASLCRSGKPPATTDRVVRGGGFGSNAPSCRPAARNKKAHDLRYDIGLRVVCTAGLE